MPRKEFAIVGKRERREHNRDNNRARQSADVVLDRRRQR